MVREVESASIHRSGTSGPNGPAVVRRIVVNRAFVQLPEAIWKHRELPGKVSIYINVELVGPCEVR